MLPTYKAILDENRVEWLERPPRFSKQKTGGEHLRRQPPHPLGTAATALRVRGMRWKPVLDRFDHRRRDRPRRRCSSRVTVYQLVMPFMAMTDSRPSARDPGTVRLALELRECAAGHRRRCRYCRSVIAENARKRGQAWSVCTPCAQAIENDAHQVEIAPALLRRSPVCRTDIAHLRAGARTCGDASGSVLSRLLRGRRHPVP